MRLQAKYLTPDFSGTSGTFDGGAFSPRSTHHPHPPNTDASKLQQRVGNTDIPKGKVQGKESAPFLRPLCVFAGISKRLCVDIWLVVPTHPHARRAFGMHHPPLLGDIDRTDGQTGHNNHRLARHTPRVTSANSHAWYQHGIKPCTPFPLHLDLHFAPPFSPTFETLLPTPIYCTYTKSHQNKMTTKYKHIDNKIKTM